jgi:hypothetical protein
MKKILSTIIASGLIFTSVQAHAGSTTGSATATVIPDVTVSQTAPLSFGTFAPGSTGGTVKIDSSGTTVTGSVQKIVNGTRGAFGVQGGKNATYTIGVPSTVTLTSGSNSMDATLTAPASGVLNSSGNGSFNVDGTITVAGNQAAGTYNGTYTVTVNY